jgi:hypothetical protein
MWKERSVSWNDRRYFFSCACVDAVPFLSFQHILLPPSFVVLVLSLFKFRAIAPFYNRSNQTPFYAIFGFSFFSNYRPTKMKKRMKGTQNLVEVFSCYFFLCGTRNSVVASSVFSRPQAFKTFCCVFPTLRKKKKKIVVETLDGGFARQNTPYLAVSLRVACAFRCSAAAVRWLPLSSWYSGTGVTDTRLDGGEIRAAET